jgi:hypothetical protein
MNIVPTNDQVHGAEFPMGMTVDQAHRVELETFIKLVLPGEGWRCAFVLETEQHGWFQTNEELITFLLAQDAAGFNVYHCNASFKNRKPRKISNVCKQRALRSDVDCGDGKEYRDRNEALHALVSFLKATGLPQPLVVASGSGIHCYWPLNRDVDNQTWRDLATALKKKMVQYGFKADHRCTMDAVRILRPPQTHNRKRGAVPVCMGNLVDPIPVEHLQAVLSVGSSFPLQVNTAANSEKAQATRPDVNASFGPSEWSPAAEARVLSVLAVISASCDRGEWFQVCASLHAHRWPNGFEICATWSRTSPKPEHKPEDLDKLWESFDREGYEGQKIGPGTLFFIGRKYGWVDTARTQLGPGPGPTPEPAPVVPPELAASAPPATAPMPPPRPAQVRALPMEYQRTREGKLRALSYQNARLGLVELRVKCRHDTFHNRKIVEGDVIEGTQELSDAICRALRDAMITHPELKFDPGETAMRQALERACEEARFDPIQNYLDSLQWDGIPRLDRWLTTYLGAADTPFVRAIGRLTLIAAVRRARLPGCKFDYILIFEGPQRAGKSSALRILAGGADNFSDQAVLHIKEQAQQEQLEGVWIYEIAELVGLKRTEVESTKTFLSRTHDKARPAYGHFRIDAPRRCIFIGTTNDADYLRDASGNSRFWPTKVGPIDLEGCRSSRAGPPRSIRSSISTVAASYHRLGRVFVDRRQDESLGRRRRVLAARPDHRSHIQNKRRVFPGVHRHRERRLGRVHHAAATPGADPPQGVHPRRRPARSQGQAGLHCGAAVIFAVGCYYLCQGYPGNQTIPVLPDRQNRFPQRSRLRPEAATACRLPGFLDAQRCREPAAASRPTSVFVPQRDPPRDHRHRRPVRRPVTAYPGRCCS